MTSQFWNEGCVEDIVLLAENAPEMRASTVGRQTDTLRFSTYATALLNLLTLCLPRSRPMSVIKLATQVGLLPWRLLATLPAYRRIRAKAFCPGLTLSRSRQWYIEVSSWCLAAFPSSCIEFSGHSEPLIEKFLWIVSPTGWFYLWLGFWLGYLPSSDSNTSPRWLT